MKIHNICLRAIIPAILITLSLGCFASSAAAQTGNPSIVGLWRVFYSGDLVFQSFEQYHSDGLEFEISNFFGLSCQGVFRQKADGSIKVFHTGWNFDENGNLIGYFNETQINKVGERGEHYTGTWDVKNYDNNGNFQSEQTGTLRAARLTVQ